MRNFSRWLFLFSLTVLSGCQTTYYAQAVKGQWQVMGARRPITEVLQDASASEALKHKLQIVQQAVAFARTELHLPVDDNFTQYVDVQREHAMWNVFAAPEFAVTPVRHCFFWVFCAEYKSYFAKTLAENEASQWQQQGYDVFVAGADAYSLGGMMEDPVFSTTLNLPDDYVVSIIFHELTHSWLSLKNDSVFNESLATTVQYEGLKRWLVAHGKSVDDNVAFKIYARHEAFVTLTNRYREQLANVYKSPLSDEEKRQKKSHIIAQLREEYKKSSFPYSKSWMDGPLNNAQLSTVGVYNDLVPAFNVLLANQKGDLEAFYDACENIADMSKQERDKTLHALKPLN